MATDNIGNERIHLASLLIQQSPPSELPDVLQGNILRVWPYLKSLDISLIFEANGERNALELLRNVIEEKNIRDGSVAMPSENGDPLIISQYNRDSSNAFIFTDSRSALKLVINPYNMEVEQSIQGEACEDELWRALNLELVKHQKETLPKGHSEISFIEERKVYSITLCHCLRQLGNMRVGKWSSNWLVNIEEAIVQGEIGVTVHYLEDGNVQLATQKKVSFAVENQANNEELAKWILRKVKSHEDEVQKAVNDSYARLGLTTFRRLRRQLPRARVKMDWSHLGSHKLRSELYQVPGTAGTTA